MFVNAIKIAKEAMFPIFRYEQVAPGKFNVSVKGTGFFINQEGYFLSVAHIFSDKNNNSSYKFLGALPEKLENPQIEIKEIFLDKANDYFIGKIDKATPIFFNLNTSAPEEGRSVCISGYPLAKLLPNAQGGIEVGGVRRYFQPSFILDSKITATSKEGITHDGFVVRDVGLFGMSGGPVFDVNGNVLGMQASVSDPRVSTNGSRTITVENAIAIKSELLIQVLEKNKVIINKIK